MERKRVLLCCEHYPPSVGGVQEVMRQVAERLASDGVDVTVVTSDHPGREQGALRNGVRVVSFSIRGNRTKGLIGPVDQYQSFLLQGKFDALLIKAAQQWTFDAALDVLPMIQSRKIFIPCGFSGLGNPLYADYFQQMAGWLRYFDGLIFYATDYQDISFARRNGVSQLYIIPNGVDEREFLDRDDHEVRRKLKIDDGDDVLLSVGSRIAAKGHWEVIRSFMQAHIERPSTLVINANSPKSTAAQFIKRQVRHISTGRWPLGLMALLAEGGCPRKRVLIVDLPRCDLVDLYKTANLFVLASHVEYSPLVLLEANAAGTPFLASPVGNSEEIARWTGGGRVVSQSNNTCLRTIPSLTREMEVMLSDRRKLKEMGERARMAIWERGLIWRRIVPQYKNCLNL